MFQAECLPSQTPSLYISLAPDLYEGNSWLSGIGFGAYHTGVEISGYEYSFSNDGIFKCPPRSAPKPAKFKETIVLGLHLGSANDVSRELRELREEFPPGSYDLLSKNCNVFSNALSLRLVGVGVPTWVNRLASTGGWFAGLGIPVRSAIEDQAVQQGSGSGNSGAAPSSPAPSAAKKELTEKQRAMLAKLKQPLSAASRT